MHPDGYLERIAPGFALRDGALPYYVSPLLERTGLVVHGFTTRWGGVSPAPFDTLNFSLKRENNERNIEQNYASVARHTGLERDSFVVVNYAHGYNVAYVDRQAARNGLPAADGISTDRRDVTLVTLHADCLPVFLLDPEKPAVTLLHAGWKGLHAHIVLKAVDFMQSAYGSRPASLLAAVGPSIGPCCFEVGEDVARLIAGEFGAHTVARRDGKLFADLWAACASDLRAAGLLAGRVNLSRFCTACDSARFFSHRRDKGKTGAMMAFLRLA